MNSFRNITYFCEDFKLHVFNGIATFGINELEIFTSEICKYEHPSEVFIYYSNIHFTEIKRYAPEIRAKFHQRFKCNPTIIVYKENGFTALEKKFDHNVSRESVISSLTKCLAILIERRKPVIKAPLGRLFSKPSGSRSSYFIQSSRILSNPTEITLVAILLLDLLGSKLSENTDTVWVDTIDLYPLVLTALRIKFPTQNVYPFIESFGSYSNLSEALRKGFSGDCLVLISASTSNNLRKTIMAQQPMIPNECIYTILTDKKTFLEIAPKNNTSILAAVDTPDEHTSKSMPCTRIQGESFALDLLPPKKITLLKKEHSLSIKNKRRLSHLIDKKVFETFGLGKNSEKHPVFVNADELISTPQFIKWYTKTLIWQLRSSTNYIVYADDIAKKMAELCLDTYPKLEIISSGQLYDKKINFKRYSSVLVVASVISHGAKLSEISKLLRESPEIGAINYVIGICTPPSTQSFSNLSKSLKMSKNFPEFPYTVNTYLILETGCIDEVNSSWQKEMQLLEASKDKPFFDTKLQNRLDNLYKHQLPTGEVFFEQHKLDFTEGFVFWETGYSTTNADASALLATIMKVLQNARENIELPEKIRLSSISSEQVLLSSENFYRFNDPLIQVAILRSALSEEMNYSEDEELSINVSYMIRRSLTLDNSVLYESLLSLALKRLRLTQKQLNLLHEDLSKDVGSNSVLLLFLPLIEKLVITDEIK